MNSPQSQRLGASPVRRDRWSNMADDIVRDYPDLEKEDVYQAARYGAWLATERVSIRA